MEPVLSLIIIAILTICCFWVPDRINPPKKETKKTPEQELNEAFLKWTKYFLAELKKVEGEGKK